MQRKKITTTSPQDISKINTLNKWMTKANQIWTTAQNNLLKANELIKSKDHQSKIIGYKLFGEVKCQKKNAVKIYYDCTLQKNHPSDYSNPSTCKFMFNLFKTVGEVYFNLRKTVHTDYSMSSKICFSNSVALYNHALTQLNIILANEHEINSIKDKIDDCQFTIEIADIITDACRSRHFSSSSYKIPESNTHDSDDPDIRKFLKSLYDTDISESSSSTDLENIEKEIENTTQNNKMSLKANFNALQKKLTTINRQWKKADDYWNNNQINIAKPLYLEALNAYMDVIKNNELTLTTSSKNQQRFLFKSYIDIGNACLEIGYYGLNHYDTAIECYNNALRLNVAYDVAKNDEINCIDENIQKCQDKIEIIQRKNNLKSVKRRRDGDNSDIALTTADKIEGQPNVKKGKPTSTQEQIDIDPQSALGFQGKFFGIKSEHATRKAVLNEANCEGTLTF